MQAYSYIKHSHVSLIVSPECHRVVNRYSVCFYRLMSISTNTYFTAFFGYHIVFICTKAADNVVNLLIIYLWLKIMSCLYFCTISVICFAQKT